MEWSGDIPIIILLILCARRRELRRETHGFVSLSAVDDIHTDDAEDETFYS